MLKEAPKSRSAQTDAPPHGGIFLRVAGIGRASRPWTSLVVLGGALLLHSTLPLVGAHRLFDLDDFARSVLNQVKSRLSVTVDVNQIEEEPPPPPETVEEPEPEPEEPEPPPVLAPTEPSEPIAEDYEPPPPEAAKAAQVITSDPQPDEPLDLTDNTFVTGSSDSYSGGNTTSAGTSDTAVRNRHAQAGGAKGSVGTRPGAQVKGPPAVDKSRPARLTPGSNSSRCRFPSEAMAEQISQMDVRVLVVVDSDGKPTSSSLRGNDPGLGFARRAKECAMRASFIPGSDKYGKPSTTTITMNIQFRL